MTQPFPARIFPFLSLYLELYGPNSRYLDPWFLVSQADSGVARQGGNVVESVSVVGVPPVYSIASWLAGCGSELPLITAW